MTSPSVPSEEVATGTKLPSVPRWALATSLCLICVISFGIRLIDVQRGLWLDELHTSWVVSDGMGPVWSRAETGNQAPFYFWMVWAFVSIGGHTEMMLRMTSVLTGTGLSIVGFQIVSKWTRSPTAGLFAAVFIAFDPLFVEYSQEARPYALLQLAGWIQVMFFVSRFQQIMEASETKLKLTVAQMGFVLSAILCFYIHFTSVLLTGACFLTILTWKVLSGSRWSRANLMGMMDFVWIALFCLPLVGTVMSISERKSNWELFVNDSTYSPVLWFQFLSYVLPAVIMIGAVVIGVAIRPGGMSRFRTSEGKQKIRFLFVLGALYFIPILGAWISLKTGIAALYHPRYFMMGSTGIILLACSAFAYLMEVPRKGSRYVGTIAFLLMIFLSVYQNNLLWSLRNDLKMPFESSWKSAVDSLSTEIKTDDTLYLFPNLIEDQFLSTSQQHRSNFDDVVLNQYCLFPLKGIYRIDNENMKAKSTLARPRFTATDAQQMLASKTVFLVIRGDQDLISEILAEFASFGPKNDLFVRSVGNRLFEFRGAPGHFIALFKFEVTAEVDQP